MPVRVYGRRTGAGGSAVIPLSVRKMALVGLSQGKSTLKSAEAVVAGASEGVTGSLHIDQVAETLRSLVRVANVSGATSEIYINGLDYVNTGRSLDWRNAAALPAPELESVGHTAGGTGAWGIATGVTFKVTAVDQANTGETIASNTLPFTITAQTQLVALQWARVPFSGGYRVYVTSTTGVSGQYYRLITLTSASSTTYTATGDTGATSILTGSPTTNTSKRRPNTGSTYYVKYYYPVYNYDRKEYTNLSDVIADHGVGSDLVNAARLAFEGGASNVWCVAVTGAGASNYTAGIDKLKPIKVAYVVPLKTGTTVEAYLRAHCEERSADTIGKERRGVVAAASGLTANEVVTWAASFGGSVRMVAVVHNGARYFANMWQTTGGTFIEGPREVAPPFAAAMWAGRICGLADTATPLTNSLGVGFTWAAGFNGWVDDEVKDTLEAGGVTYIMNEATTPVVYHGITCNTASVENQEISVGDAEDEMRERIRVALSQYRGKDRKITQNRLGAIASTVEDILAYLVKNAIIQEHGSINVTQDENDPTLIWVRFNYTPIYPINQIIFEYGFATAPLTAAA